MAKKGRKAPIVNAFRCKFCGKVVAPVHRSRHLIVAHKMSGYNIKEYFTDLGTPFKINPLAKAEKIRREYERNLGKPKKEFECGSNPVEPKPFKLIYTPMGNKR